MGQAGQGGTVNYSFHSFIHFFYLVEGSRPAITNKRNIIQTKYQHNELKRTTVNHL